MNDSNPISAATRKRNEARKIVLCILVALVVVYAMLRTLKGNFVENYRVATDTFEPEYPRDSILVVSKINVKCRPGDMIIYQDEHKDVLGKVVSVDAVKKQLVVRDNHVRTITNGDVVGRVMLKVE